MAIVGALDIHRRQITFDGVDHDSGESGRGRISPADRVGLRKWLAQFEGKPVELVVEGCTGWRFVAEECQAAGATVHVADPAEAAGPRTERGTRQTVGSATEDSLSAAILAYFCSVSASTGVPVASKDKIATALA